jgi:hypothetical protein
MEAALMHISRLLIEKLRGWIFVLSVECNMLCYWQNARTNCALHSASLLLLHMELAHKNQHR